MQLRLNPLYADPDRNTAFAQHPHLQELLAIYADYYPKIGFQQPWISYVAEVDGEYAGSCGFKGAPRDGQVEIAYWTFPAWEGRGIASEMCRQLVQIATAHDPTVRITARTLPEENASTRILRRQGFVWLGVVVDVEDGEVWEWEWPR